MERGRGGIDGRLMHLLAPREHAAAMELVRRVRLGVPAELWRAFLFGSRARGEGRPDSDLDVLLVFHELPPDREPQAGIAEWIADEVAEDTGIPVTVWSVSRVDLERGLRTPMLVDALDDGIPLWPVDAPPVSVRYTPDDALFCASALLDRVEEGSEEVLDALDAGEPHVAARRIRDDLVRMCTAALLLDGITRPRRAEAVAAFAARHDPPPDVDVVLHWAAASFGPDGRDGDGPIAAPPGGLGFAADAVEAIRRLIIARGRELRDRVGDGR
ncbi:MAG: nucleotidyltransferase domain-containing protein [Gemmatimonadetes bacterium]|nr:nucleotidyltransferase domain-containing protein [Gemmatimonadota bacterium]